MQPIEANCLHGEYRPTCPVCQARPRVNRKKRRKARAKELKVNGAHVMGRWIKVWGVWIYVVRGVPGYGR